MIVSAIGPELLEDLRKFLKRKRPQPAKMKNEGVESEDERKPRYDDRDSNVSWFPACSEIPALHNRFCELLKEVEACAPWGPLLPRGSDGSLECTFEETQYAVYGPGQHFNAWHQDAYAKGGDLEDARQLTIVAMISDRKDYTGGAFEAKVQGDGGARRKVRRLRMEAGDAIIFPAKQLMHRVTSVTTGVRKTLVFWASDRMSCKYYNPALRSEDEDPAPA